MWMDGYGLYVCAGAGSRGFIILYCLHVFMFDIFCNKKLKQKYVLYHPHLYKPLALTKQFLF